MKPILTILFLLFFLSAYAQVSENADSSFQAARESKLPVLLVFAGSDWCVPCMRFNKDILSNKSFIDFSKNTILVLKADFPQRRTLGAEQVRQNELLAEKYNPNGAFPHIVLLNSEEEVVTTIVYNRQTSEAFINELNNYFGAKPMKEYKKRVSAMGSFFEFIIVQPEGADEKASILLDQCVEEVDRIESLISEWIPTSEVSKINKMAGIEPVSVSEEVYHLILRSIKTGDLTQGAFDITFHALDGLWKFDGTQVRPPSNSQVKVALEKVGYQKIQISEGNAVFLPDSGMSIGFGGIGQGYAVDQLKEMLVARGIENFVVNSSGDIYASGHKADGTPWKIGIADPFDKIQMIRWLDVVNQAVVTSGNYEKYFEYNGKKYAHIIDPKTGWPTSGIMSVTVFSPVTEIADALATAIFVLGKDVGLNLVDQLPETHCVIIDEKKNVFYSAELKDQY